MKKIILVVGGILIVVVVLVLVMSQNKSQVSTITPAGTTTSLPNSVSIKNFSFNPSTLNVKVGTTVTWTNEDTVTHTIKSDTFSSGNLSQGDTFKFTFSTPGTFNYSCGIHPTMTGTIVVQ